MEVNEGKAVKGFIIILGIKLISRGDKFSPIFVC